MSQHESQGVFFSLFLLSLALFAAFFFPGLPYFFNKSVSEDFEFISGCSVRFEKKTKNKHATSQTLFKPLLEFQLQLVSSPCVNDEMFLLFLSAPSPARETRRLPCGPRGFLPAWII